MSSFLLLFFSLAFLGSLSPLTADQPFLTDCEKERNFTAGSVFQTNLESLVLSLTSSTPSTGFAKDTIGEAPNVVYGLASCRGDLGFDDCRKCLSNATNDAKFYCPGNRGAVLFYDLCQLRYSDRDFFGTSTGVEFFAWNIYNVSDLVLFNRRLGGILDDLTVKAASSVRRFAAGYVDYNEFQRLYALVQCTADLSARTCEDCLRGGIGQIPTCCNAKQGARIVSRSCRVQYELFSFFNESAVAGAPPPPSPPVGSSLAPAESPDAQEKTNRRTTVIVAVAASVFAVVAFSAFMALCIRRRRRIDRLSCKIKEDAIEERDSLQFSLDDLKLATMNFSDQNKLGEGGFGAVYKAILHDGQSVAVKRLMNNIGEGFEELKNEIALVAKLQHRNLVRLLGYCLEAQEKILIYEYLPNKSLDSFLFDPIRSESLTWEKRVRIIEGISRGLLYLHEDSRLKIIHRDLKASNILLDEAMNPKIADFGLARLLGNEQSYGNTQRIAGTYGYMAPEYMMHGHISPKSDVYSFGVLLLEILTGRKCIGFHGSNPPTDLIGYIWRLWKEGDPFQVLDKNLAESCPPDEVLRYFHIGLLCVQPDPLKRPNMSHVLLFLSSISTALPEISSLIEDDEISISTSQNSIRQSPPMRNLEMPRLPIQNGFSGCTDSMTLEAR
ncbi:cysteine-rich receptor-like protein kinase 10 isoform X2 [Wolffia australiana]